MTEHSVRRIASLQPSVTVILDAIGELGRVVACTKYCADVVSEIAQRAPTILSDSWTADASQIIATNPDLVIAAVPYQEKAVVEILKAGVRFLGLAPKSLADIYVDISVIGGVVGANERSAEVISAMEQRIDEVRKRRASACGRGSSVKNGASPLSPRRSGCRTGRSRRRNFIGEPGRKFAG